jgi:hypothetical protein
MRAILCGGSLIFYAAQNQHFKNPAKTKKELPDLKNRQKAKRAFSPFRKSSKR